MPDFAGTCRKAPRVASFEHAVRGKKSQHASEYLWVGAHRRCQFCSCPRDLVRLRWLAPSARFWELRSHYRNAWVYSAMINRLLQVLAVVFIALGALWALQGAGFVHIKPILCVADCTELQGASGQWLLTGIGAIAVGMALWYLRPPPSEEIADRQLNCPSITGRRSPPIRLLPMPSATGCSMPPDGDDTWKVLDE